jgi:hypothetical protein
MYPDSNISKYTFIAAFCDQAPALLGLDVRNYVLMYVHICQSPICVFVAIFFYPNKPKSKQSFSFKLQSAVIYIESFKKANKNFFSVKAAI